MDLSPEMVAAAKEKGVDARVMDGHSMAFEDEFDAVFSNAALHWMSEDPGRVVQSEHSQRPFQRRCDDGYRRCEGTEEGRKVRRRVQWKGKPSEDSEYDVLCRGASRDETA